MFSVLVRIDQTSVCIEPFSTGPETLYDQAAPVGNGIGTVCVLLYGSRYDLFIETLFKSALIVNVLGCENFSYRVLGKRLV